jgi:protein-disulfide isomerase
MSMQNPPPDSSQETVQVMDAAIEPKEGKRFPRWLLAGLGGAVLLGSGLFGGVLIARSQYQAQYQGIGSSSPINPAAPSPAQADEATEVDAESEARRAEWQARQQQAQAVVSSMDRTTLIGSSPTRGAQNAPIVLIKFSDFECPYCALAAADMKTFTRAHEQDVLYVYKHFPLVSIHDQAMGAAKAAWAAGQQGQFWLYHDGLFAYQDRLGDGFYVELAIQIGLDVVKFNRDRNSPQAQAAIDQDIALARQLNLNGTPMFLMNDLLIPPGAPPEFFEQAVTIFKQSLANP